MNKSRQHRRGTMPAVAGLAVVAAVVATIWSGMGSASASPLPLVGAGSRKCLDVAGGGNVNGARLQVYYCNGGPNQAFQFTAAGELRVFGGRACVDVYQDRTAPGSLVDIWTCHGGASQKWRQNGDGSITAARSGLCLDAAKRGTTARTPVILWPCNGQSNQRWTLGSGSGVPPVSGATTPGTPPPVSAPTTLPATSASPTSAAPTTVPPTVSPTTRRPPTSTAPTSTAPTTGPSGTVGGTGTSCDIAPADPRATRQARNVICYLYSVYGNHILSGQQESTWVDGPDYEMNYIHNATGKYPAIRGLDMGDSPTFGGRAVSWWRSGGIPMVSYHMGAPNQDVDGYAGSQLTANINAALTPGTPDYTRLTRRLDAFAAQLRQVQDVDGAIIVRPWHEAGGTWFWWSKEGGSSYVRLWKFTFDYLTGTQGLHNLIWLMPYNGSPNASFYPGKAYVDIGGADTYANDHGPQAALYQSTRAIVGSTIPIALHENGRIPDPGELQSAGARWVLFNTWHSTFISDTSINPVSTLRAVYGSPYVITRDELPDLR